MGRPLDDALTAFAATGPTYGRLDLANHGPMVAEALDSLGRPEAIAPWTDRYLARLDPAPTPDQRPLGDEEWPQALGQRDQLGGWLALFEREVADRPVSAVVGEWAPRLLPGSIGAAAHGLIRTGHALRGLARSDSPPRRLEVALALAFWATVYEELPGPPLLIGHEGVGQALADLPYLPEEAPRGFLISDRVAAVAGIADEFEQAVASLGWTGGPVALLDQLASGGAAAYLRNADGGWGHRVAPRRHRPAGLRAAASVARRIRPGRRVGLRLAGHCRCVARGLRRRPGVGPRSTRARRRPMS